MFWVDEISEDIIKKIPKDSYLITDWMTTSGSAHVGSLRGVIVHDLVRRGLSESQKQAQFQWGFDDFDPMDGLPSYLDKSWLEHMGKPLCRIPAPDGKHESFAAQYADEFLEVFKKINISPKVVYTSGLYKEGLFNEAIKLVLDHAEEIRKIYLEISGSQKGDDWYPFQVICPNCNKIGTTKVIGWDGQEVEFTCEENLVTWAKGCGFSGKISPYDGHGKMPWKVEWPAKWSVTKTDIEGEGKDHFAAGGSRDIADKIYRQIFAKTPPYDVRYEHILIGGAKMSSSKGLGVTAREMAQFLPANILRFLLTRTRAKKAIDFTPEGDSIPLLYDEFDRAWLAYNSDPESDLGRAFYYTALDLTKEQPKYLLRFSKIAYMLQMPKVDVFEYARQEKGEELSESEHTEIQDRVQVAKTWLELYAPEAYKFEIQKTLPDQVKNLQKEQKEFLAKILELIKTKDFSGEELHQEIHNLKKEMAIDPRQAFSAIYLIFLGKDSGPQAGWLLASLDKNFVLNRLAEAQK